MKMKKLEELTNKINNIDLDKISKRVFSLKVVRDYLINRQKKRLGGEGVTTDGEKIRTYKAIPSGVYSGYTMNKKNENTGLASITDHVTLFETGSFYKSMMLEAKETLAQYIADKNRLSQLSENLDTRRVLGLADEKGLIEFIKPYYLKEIKEELNV